MTRWRRPFIAMRHSARQSKKRILGHGVDESKRGDVERLERENRSRKEKSKGRCLRGSTTGRQLTSQTRRVGELVQVVDYSPALSHGIGCSDAQGTRLPYISSSSLIVLPPHNKWPAPRATHNIHLLSLRYLATEIMAILLNKQRHPTVMPSAVHPTDYDIFHLNPPLTIYIYAPHVFMVNGLTHR